MKVVVKTVGWAVISGGIIFVGAIAGEAPVIAAVYSTFFAVVMKTPAYSIFEWSFERVWSREKNIPAHPCG